MASKDCRIGIGCFRTDNAASLDLISCIEWLLGNTVQKLIVVLASTVTGDVKERWQFDIECDKTYTENRCAIPYHTIPYHTILS